MVSNCGDRGLFTIWTRSFWIKIIFPFPVSSAKWISDYFDIKGCGANNLERAHRSSLCQWRCGQNSQRKLWTRFELPDFFLVRAESLFTLWTFGAQINWCVIMMKVLFDPHRFLSNKSPIHFAGQSRKGNTFLNGKWHVQNKNGHRSPPIPDLCPTTVKILTHLISRYHLPFRGPRIWSEDRIRQPMYCS